MRAGRLCALGLLASLLPSSLAGTCGRLVKDIDFRGQNTGPYTEIRAVRDFEPVLYLDGWHDDKSTKGLNNKRVNVDKSDSKNALRVLLPQGCTTSACGMQAKAALPRLESATLEMRFKFDESFDWVRGGKLPGFCGGTCPTGCKKVSGYDGFSARHMWRPCIWPPESPLNSINCQGGKLASYVYHTKKVHWCGDDFDFENDAWARTYTTPKTPVVHENFFQPQQGEWYTIWSKVVMNTVGKEDGVLETWIEGPGMPPTQVVNKQDMLWRKDYSFAIDTLYFSLFFGGSSPSFAAHKDEDIWFEYLKVYEGDCTPAGSGQKAEKVTEAAPKAGLITGALAQSFSHSALESSFLVTKTFTGGACGKISVINKGDEACTAFEVAVAADPEWGSIAYKDVTGKLNTNFLIPTDLKDEKEGIYQFYVHGPAGKVQPRKSIAKAGFCFETTRKAYTTSMAYYSERIQIMARCVENTMIEIDEPDAADGFRGDPSDEPDEPVVPTPVDDSSEPDEPAAPVPDDDVPTPDSGDYGQDDPETDVVGPAEPMEPEAPPAEPAEGPPSGDNGGGNADGRDPAAPSPGGPVDEEQPLSFEITSTKIWSSKVCVDVAVGYEGPGACLRMALLLDVDPKFLRLRGQRFKAINFQFDEDSGDTSFALRGPKNFGAPRQMGIKRLPSGESHTGRLCMDYADGYNRKNLSEAFVRRAFRKVSATCLRHS